MTLIDKVLADLGNPRVYYVSPEQFKVIEGDDVGEDCGLSSLDYPIFTIAPRLKRRARKNTIYHEVLHLILPSKREWWVELASEILAKGGGKGEYTKLTGHTLTELPTRSELLKAARRASARFNERTAVKKK